MQNQAFILNLANSITLSRVPLALAMWWKPNQVRFVLKLILLAAFTDILDGWVARQSKKRHPSGVWLDPLCDKIFILSTLCAVSHSQRPPKSVPLLIALREVTQFPLILLYFLKSVRKPIKVNFESAHWGKIATCIQFLAIGAVLVHKKWMKPLSLAAGITGLGATSFYLKRSLKIGSSSWRTAQPLI